MSSSKQQQVDLTAAADLRVLRAAAAVAAQPCHSRHEPIDQLRVLPIVAAASDHHMASAATVRAVLNAHAFTPAAEAKLRALLLGSNTSSAAAPGQGSVGQCCLA